MDKPLIIEKFKPILEKPIFVQGLPGLGNVGRIATNLLIKFCDAKVFAELYSPSFPDYVYVDSTGICKLPRYEFYSAPLEKNNFIIMTGETQPSFNDVLAHYQVCGKILDYIEKQGCEFIVTIGGVAINEEKVQIYIAATSSRLAKEFAEKGAITYSKGRIVGGTGLTLALAKERGFQGVCLLGATTGLKADQGAGFSTFKFLMRVLGKEINDS